MQRVSISGLCHLSKGCCLSLALKQLGHCPIHGCLPCLLSFGSPIMCILSLGTPTDLGFPVLQQLLTPWPSGCSSRSVHTVWEASGPLCPHAYFNMDPSFHSSTFPSFSIYHVCLKSHLSVRHPPLHGLLQHFCRSYFSVCSFWHRGHLWDCF